MMATLSLADIARFVGDYEGMAQILRADGTAQARNMSVAIDETSEGFSVNWTSGTRRADGSLKTKSYEIDFKPSAREGIFAAAQKKNIFGHAVQLDPMKGEPYVWAQIIDDTLTVYSLYVTDDGGYEMQQYDRTLAEGGLNLNFQIIKNGEPLRSVSTFLVKQ
ncbi:MAG: hypothetical protein HRU30_15505 [Rhodobacteraceae bacterium]|nr:hypothetical protein [Paracoccaceae bacterium]